jgi:hypothetical protein
VSHFDQTVFGVFGNYEHEPWRVTGTAYYVDVKPETFTGSSSYQGYLVGYLQAERSLPHGLQIFARLEDSARTERSAYLSLFPDFVKSRTTLGLRWDFARRQALTFQAAASESLRDSYGEFRVQWSAAVL